MSVVEIGHNVETFREAAAKRIKQLMHTWTANTLALGAELTSARDTFPSHPTRPERRMGFVKWAKQATGLSQSQISNLLHVHKTFGHRQLGNVQFAAKVMVLLSREGVPESARLEAVDRAKRGEHVAFTDAQKIIKAHRPTPKAANTQAKEEGRPVLASDGYIYFGTDPAKAKEGEDRRSMVFGVRRALDHLGNINLTGRQFLDYALPHQLWTAEEAPIIRKALRWLADLEEAWESRK